MNRQHFFQVLTLALILLVPAVQATDASYRADPQHTGVYAASATQPNNVLKWSFNKQNNPITGAAVADGVIYFGSYDSNLYAVNAADGTTKWKFKTGKMILSAPSVANGIVYFGSTDQHIYAVNAADGSLRWKLHTNSTYDGGIGTSAPAVVGGTVYIVSFDKNLYALDADTGAVRWRYPYIPSGGETGCSPVVANGVVYFGDINRIFYAVNAADGTERWRYNGPGGHAASPPPVPVIADGVLYVAGPGYHTLTGLNADTGAFMTSISRGTATNWELLSPAVADGIIYTGGADLNLYAVDAATGSDRWSFPLGSLLRSSPSVSDGIVYAPSMANTLYAIFANNGTEKWRFSPPDTGGLWGAPVIADGVVYMDGGGSYYYAVGNQQAAPLFFSGRVRAGNVGDFSGRSLGGIPVHLYGSATDTEPGALLDTTATDGSGYYLLPAPPGSYPYISIITEDPIPGSTPTGAQSVSGTVKNASWIQHTTPLAGKDLTGNNFWDYVPTVHGNFTAGPLTGPAPLTVTFTDQSTGYPTNWNWVLDYNRTIDNGFIVCLAPTCTYTYSKPGLYSVQMRISNAISHEWVTRLDYINVTAAPGVLPLPGQSAAPTDPDNDGIYEDLNGNGRADFADLTLYFLQMDWIEENEPVDAFDPNGNGRIDFADISRLFDEL